MKIHYKIASCLVLSKEKLYTQNRKIYSRLENKLFNVPEIIKTCKEAALPAKLVTAATDDLTIPRLVREVLTTPTLLSASKSIRDRPVWLAPTSP